MNIILNVNGLTSGTSLTLPENFFLQGLGVYKSKNNIFSIPGINSSYNSGNRYLEEKKLILKADYAGVSESANLAYWSSIIDFLEKSRTYISRKPEFFYWENTYGQKLRIYHRSSMFFWIDSYVAKQKFTPMFNRKISETEIELNLADPFCYSDINALRNCTPPVSHDPAGDLMDINNYYAIGDAVVRPVIRIIPKDGEYCNDFTIEFEDEHGEIQSCRYQNPLLNGSRGGGQADNPSVFIDCYNGNVWFLQYGSIPVANYINDIANFSGLFPIVTNKTMTDSPVKFKFICSGAAYLFVYWKAAYYA